MIGRLRRAIVELVASLGTALVGLVTNRMRAFLSTLGIAIGIATLIAIYAMVQGLSATFAQQISMLGSSTLYVTQAPWIQRDNWWKYRNRPPIAKKDVDALVDQGDLLAAVAPIAFAVGAVEKGDTKIEFVQIRGTTDRYIETSRLRVAGGRFLSPIDVDMERGVVVIGSDVRARLFPRADPLGATINVAGQRMTVIGDLRPEGKSFGQSLDNVVFLPMGAFQRLFGDKHGFAIAVTAKEGHLNEAKEQIIEVLRRSRGLAADQEENFAVNQQSELVKIFQSQTAAIVAVSIAIGLITLLVGGIGVMNIMLVAVTERTREIGLRRALGARRRTILMQFLLESSLVTLVGGAAGTAIGLGGARVIAIVTPVPASATVGAAILGLVSSAIIGLAFGTWPAYRASLLDPIESLRYE
jgi:putative ABC transport system permease protein